MPSMDLQATLKLSRPLIFPSLFLATWCLIIPIFNCSGFYLLSCSWQNYLSQHKHALETVTWPFVQWTTGLLHIHCMRAAWALQSMLVQSSAFTVLHKWPPQLHLPHPTCRQCPVGVRNTSVWLFDSKFWFFPLWPVRHWASHLLYFVVYSAHPCFWLKLSGKKFFYLFTYIYKQNRLSFSTLLSCTWISL